MPVKVEEGQSSNSLLLALPSQDFAGWISGPKTTPSASSSLLHPPSLYPLISLLTSGKSLHPSFSTSPVGVVVFAVQFV